MIRIMERIIFPNSVYSRLHSDAPVFRRFARFDLTPKFVPSPPSSRKFQSHLGFSSRRLNYFLTDLHDSTSLTAKSVENHVEDVSASEDLRNLTESESQFLQQIAHKYSQQQKVFCLGTVIFLSAICLFFHPNSVLPAFASFRGATGTGGPAVVAAGSSLVRIELLSSAWTGFLAGCLHTLSGPDHLAALAPLSIGRTSMESAAVGALWGCGHDAGQLIFGLLFLFLKDRLHIEIIRTWGSRVVGLTLLVIGAMGIREASEVPAPRVAMEDVECDVNDYQTLPDPSMGKKKIGFATFATGIVHGLQPDALMMILPALALPSRLAGAAFLFMFLIGTVVAMGSYTVFIGSCSQALKDRIPRITEKLTWASSIIAIGLGLTIILSQFFGFSLY